MELIVGGAYQGKLEYVKKTYQIKDEEVFYCEEDAANPQLDLSKKVIYQLENFILACVKQGIGAREYLMDNRGFLENKIIVCMDISQGIVPMDREMRAWREMNGRALIYLSEEAENVVRIFCGLPHKIK
ncbi:bifunctional adenosylcobinamide kinase/adenosylcobinamide-phosphate guanylyltransferase [Clostridium aminobutyricum]|uniref:Bifunctional adenosylcobinamide kinase/adenosylcobinamide-phosphate guanylyltransferase n=1 Tax=Clostridium aminobutyricum TaxID=33953 RepID=A0A939DB51_CLOAM|nr:bifunctional adenosylcobinamide kinase/adenosylcobinamide-phosphate guanylyltransferase [Clostridium aminobutyricum]MBN7774367.1 bifunctional adenosylcobinamide kinase/adenosylcobinamide-phosphate guanylyltransferase [Clostridium aminobutyricum]